MRHRRVLLLAFAVGLLLVLSVPALAVPGKVIKQTGNDATTMSPDKVLSWAVPASVVGDATIRASWGTEYPLEADVHLSGGRFTWNYPGGLYATGWTSNLSVVGSAAEFRMTVDDETHPSIDVGWVLGMRIVDGSPDTVAWWWISGGSGSIGATPVVDGDFVVTPSAYMQYDNACVHNAIADGYRGKVNMIQPAGNVDIILGMSFGSLDPGSYTVYIDPNGGTPGGWFSIGTFVADELGEGEFNYTLPAGTLLSGTHTWAVWVNGPPPCASVLQTDSDLVFTIGDAA